MTTYKCDKCLAEIIIKIDDSAPTCRDCSRIATHYNSKTGEVYEWLGCEDYRMNVQAMNDQMDAAFDNTYFSGGW